MPDTARVLKSDDSCPALSLVDGDGDARAVAWPGVGSKLRSMARIWLGAAARTKAMSRPMEAVYYVIGGEGQVIDAAAETANMNFVRLEPGEANIPHIHARSEDTIFILQGKGTLRDFDHDLELPFEAGNALQVPVGVKHAVAADRGIGVISVGGPCPADYDMLKAAGIDLAEKS